ncbi:hypothetical protein [Streptomyces phaeochromogenes]
MSPYNRPATVIADDVSYAVHADLRNRKTGRERLDSFGGRSGVGGGEDVWGGTLQAESERDAWAIERAESRTLRLEDGAERGFSVRDESDLAAGTLEVEGFHTAPFDD